MSAAWRDHHFKAVIGQRPARVRATSRSQSFSRQQNRRAYDIPESSTRIPDLAV